MKKFLLLACATIVLSACEKAVLPEDDLLSEETESTIHSAKLNIVASAEDEAGEGTLNEGKVFIFNHEDKCVQLLTMNEEDHRIEAQIPAGQYTLYAIGGDDLTRFDLPSQEEATPTSVITRLSGKMMTDLMMATAYLDVAEGETLNQNISLTHVVFCLDEIELREMPAGVTSVEVTLAPLYSAVQLDGSYEETPTESYKVALEKQTDGTTWKTEKQQMLFPSKGKPTIKVSMITTTGSMSYSFTSAEELEPNHHFDIIGTYKATQGVSLSGIMTDAGWGEDRTINFDIDEKDVDEVKFVAGQFFQDYYVVSVDEAQRRAVLLAKEDLTYTAPAEGAASSVWQASFVAPMAALAKPAGATGNWRLPTLDEVDIFARDTQVVSFNQSSGDTMNFYCLGEEEKLCWAYIHRGNNGTELKWGTSGFIERIRLRPVIEVAF
ncbi:MAG: FimB/Mfa2 family fimbrial subunit [Prevotella sp.]|nr:FimB/Mfa2 family fimbrial subunit [Prevotella sp.]